MIRFTQVPLSTNFGHSNQDTGQVDMGFIWQEFFRELNDELQRPAKQFFFNLL